MGARKKKGGKKITLLLAISDSEMLFSILFILFVTKVVKKLCSINLNENKKETELYVQPKHKEKPRSICLHALDQSECGQGCW